MPWTEPEPILTHKCDLPYAWSGHSRRAGHYWVCTECGNVYELVWCNWWEAFKNAFQYYTYFKYAGNVAGHNRDRHLPSHVYHTYMSGKTQTQEGRKKKS